MKKKETKETTEKKEEQVIDEACTHDCSTCGGCGDIDPETIIQILGSRNQELEEKYMRLQAEYLNYKTRTQTEVSRMLQYEGEDFIKEILVIKDNFERAIMMDDNDIGGEVNNFLSGFKIMYSNLTLILKKYGVEEINRVGEIFDPNQEEALLTASVEGKANEEVLEVLLKGYKLKDKVIRPASVKVNIEN